MSHQNAPPPGPPPPYSATPGAHSASILQSKGELRPSSPNPSSSLRTLLLIYIHGFYGNDQSFRSFPAHVHDHLSIALSNSHQIHTKIYPRYKTYKAIDIARDNLIAWLEPHVSPSTDVILLGHSMGGLLAADVVLKPSQSRHGILGTISLDSPFLGLHPRIVVSGISSLFRPDAQQQQLFVPSASPADPNYDPPFFNDAPFRERPLLDRVVNFATKHSSEGLFNAMGNHIAHHLEFGGCLADYPGLKARYSSIRALDDAVGARRVRFVNYYTLSSGRPRPPKNNANEKVPQVDDHSGTEPCTELQEMDPVPMEAEGEQPLVPMEGGELPPIPDPPSRPEAPDLTLLDSADARRQAEKEFAKLEKEFAKLEKAHAKTLRERDKLVEKQRRQMEKQAERRRKDAIKAEKEAEKEAAREEKRLEKLERKRLEADKAERRLGKFCTLPPSVDGVADRTWVEVYMDGVDEIGAHCGLFVPGEHYDGLVGDVGGRIVSWVNER